MSPLYIGIWSIGCWLVQSNRYLVDQLLPIFELHPHFLIVARCREWSKIFGDNEVIIVAAAFVVIAKRENLREDNLKKKKRIILWTIWFFRRYLISNVNSQRRAHSNFCLKRWKFIKFDANFKTFSFIRYSSCLSFLHRILIAFDLTLTVVDRLVLVLTRFFFFYIYHQSVNWSTRWSAFRTMQFNLTHVFTLTNDFADCPTPRARK